MFSTTKVMTSLLTSLLIFLAIELTVMQRKDPTAFRARVEAYKNGKPIDEIYDGGYIKEPVITPDPLYNEYINSLPDNQRLTPESSYRSHRYWELNDKPKNFSEAVGRGMFNYDFTDNSWHANSVALNKKADEYEFMKPNWHDTKMYEDAWYYSKNGENFRSEYTKKPGAAYDKYLPRHKNGKLPKYENGIPAYQTFVEEMGPILYKEAVSLGVANPDVAYRNMLTLLAYESNYGTSSVARKLNNYGGVGWNGKTYTTYKNKEDFAKNYVRLMNSRYKNVIGADTLSDYAKGLKKLGYYEDTLENYSRNLTNMKSFARAMDNHFANNKSLYLHTPVQAPVIQRVEPAVSTAVRKTIPQSQTIARWTGAENVSPYVTGKPMVKLNPIIKLPTLELIMDDAEWEPEYNLPGYKNGKLPGFEGGKPKGDGMKYSWNDIELNWDRYTGDAMGDIFADFVVTPRGGAHKKDIQPLRIVTPEQELYVEKTQPAISTNSTWHYTPTPQTFAGRVAQAFGGDWKTADITSSGLSLRPELSIPLGVMDFGYNLNQSVHNLTDTDAHIDTALSAAAILPFVGGGLKLLKGKDVGTKMLNAYNNYMHSLGNVDDINNTLKNVRYLDSATDAAPAIKATGENPFKYGGDSLKTMDLFNKMRSILIRGKLAQIRPQQPDLVNAPYGIRDLANDVIHHEGMPEGVEDIFRYQILPRTNISKMNYDNTINMLSRYGYNTLDDYNWAKYVDDNLAGYLDNSTYGIALREPYIRTAGPHEFRHRMLHLVPYKRSLAIDREAYLNRAYDEDFVNLPNVVDESDNLYGYPHMADEKATTNLDARNYAFANFTNDPNIGKMSVTELNKFLDSLSDDLIIEAVANSNGYGKRYIHFLERKYDMLNNPKTNAQWANKFRNAMKYYGSFALPAAIVASLPEYSNGKSPIHIKPANRGKFTALKKRTGHSASWFKENGTPKQKKMAVFALNAKKWKH